MGFGLRFLRPRLGPGLRRDVLAAALEALQRDVERLEWDGAVPEHLVPRRGPGEMLLEPDHGLGEVLDLPDVETFLRVRPSVLGRLEGGIQSEGRVEALERFLEPFQPE